MSKIAQFPTQRRALPSPLQEELFALDDTRYSNTIDLWDVAPRWVFYTDKDLRVGGVFLSSIERTFNHHGKCYRLTLRPARIKRNGKEVEEYPGAREQIVEEVIRRLAVEPTRLKVLDEDRVSLAFSLYEVRAELQKQRHCLSIAEIKEALQILRHAEVEISRVDGESGNEVVTTISTSTFPQMKLREKGEGGESWIQFNDYVALALKRLEFRQINYELSMRFKDPVARWLYKRLYHNAVYSDYDSPLHILTASEIHRDCGLSDHARWRDVLRRVSNSVKAAEGEDVAKIVEAREIWGRDEETGRPRKNDIEFELELSESLMAEIAEAKRRNSEINKHYRDVIGSAPLKFAPMTPEKTERSRRLRIRKA